MHTILKFHKRLVTFFLTLAVIIGTYPSISASAAESYNGGWAFSKEKHNVYSTANGESIIGSIGREGITVLSQSGSTYYIEYSTSKGAKRGYIKNPNIDTSYLASSCVAKVVTNYNLYYGPNTSTYASTGGSVYAGEYVAVIAKEGNWVYVEYNTNSGRKRGYMPYANLYCYNRPTYFADFYMSNKVRMWELSEGTVKNTYFGPNDEGTYGKVGYIDHSDSPAKVYYAYYYGNGEAFHYTEYTVGGKIKSGFFRWDLY